MFEKRRRVYKLSLCFSENKFKKNEGTGGGGGGISGHTRNGNMARNIETIRHVTRFQFRSLAQRLFFSISLRNTVLERL